ncbi:UPF0172 domain containing protein [Trichuris trichiura]|uniref:UPF0172 domain containing protein n=1 Tax=Trichuris trichiura TaxID=36087 RepID=A0A077Z9V8_TRITR|nr:UPF0172 domain containing protein [Trichuris trichiura]
MAEVGLSYLALAKVILHAAKYPHCCVNGFLIGHKAEKGRRVRIVDAVPLLHRWQVLTPMTELALIQVSTACSFDTNSKLQIVGYYQANEQLEDETIFLDNSRVAEAAIRSCLKEKLYRSLTDFDDHLENVSLDFWNTKLNEELEAVL